MPNVKCDNCKESFHSRCTGGTCNCDHGILGAGGSTSNMNVA